MVSDRKDNAEKTWMERIEAAVRELTECLEAYLAALSSGANSH